MELPDKLVSVIEENGFSILGSGPETLRVEKRSPCGQAFEIAVDSYYITDLPEALLANFNYYDPSYEAYLWLDDTGHGKNGAPWCMGTVYADMVECKNYIWRLYQIISAYIRNNQSEGE